MNLSLWPNLAHREALDILESYARKHWPDSQPAMILWHARAHVYRGDGAGSRRTIASSIPEDSD